MSKSVKKDEDLQVKNSKKKKRMHKGLAIIKITHTFTKSEGKKKRNRRVNLAKETVGIVQESNPKNVEKNEAEEKVINNKSHLTANLNA